MLTLDLTKIAIFSGALAGQIVSCGDDETGDDGASASASSASTSSETSVGPTDGSASATSTSGTSTTTSDDASSSRGETTVSSNSATGGSSSAGSETGSTTGEACVCTDDIPACEPGFRPGAECDGANPNTRCCHTDGPYTCICPFAPPCEWTKDPCD